MYSVEMLTTNLMDILNRLESRNSIEDILILIAVEALLWSIFSLFLTLFLPKRYKPYKFEIFIFLVINIGLLFIGFILTIIWFYLDSLGQHNRVSRPHI